MEIGSEFYSSSCKIGKNNYINLVNAEKRYVLSGRTALFHAAEDIKSKRRFKKAALPAYCCRTMIEPFVEAGVQVCFYSRSNSADDIKADAVLIMDYFGFMSGKTAEFAAECKAKGMTVIVDATQTAFSGSDTYNSADYITASYRKWFDCLCAAVYSKDGFSIAECTAKSDFTDMWRSAAAEKKKYIESGTGDKNNFLGVFAAANHNLAENWKNCRAEAYEKEQFENIDSEFIRSSRRRNAKILLEGLAGLDGIKPMFERLNENDCPLFLPVMLDTKLRSELRRELTLNSIYCPIHWPLTDLHSAVSDRLPQIFDTELSLVCDQRYGEEDMKRTISCIRRFFDGRETAVK